MDWPDWEERFAQKPGPCRSLLTGEIQMPKDLAPPPKDPEKAKSTIPGPATGWRKAPTVCIAGLEHHWRAHGTERHQGRLRKRCANCHRVVIIEGEDERIQDRSSD